MNLNQLKFVKTLAETASFSKAAEMCFVTQPTLSNAVAQLEDELGGRIFSRTTRKVGLTTFGEHMLPQIIGIVESQDALIKAAQAYFSPAHKLIRVGLSPLIDTRLLNTVLEPFRRDEPEVDIIFKECLLDDLHGRLDNQKLDVAFTLKNRLSPDMQSCFFYEEELYYLQSDYTADSIRPAASVRLEDVATDVFIVTKGCGLAQAVRELFKSQGLKLLEYKGQALNYPIAQQWASLGIGSTILPQSKITTDYQFAQPLALDSGKTAALIYVAAWNRQATHPTHIKRFIKHQKKTVPELVKGIG